MRLQAVLFDLDGTLLDTAGDMGAAANHVIDSLSLPLLSKAILQSTCSDGAYALLRAGIPPTLIEQHGIEVLRKQMLDFYRANLCYHTRPYQGVSSLLNWLTQADIPWGVVTNKPAMLTEPLLAMLPLFSGCGITVSADTIAYKKPHPAPLLYAAEQLSVAPAHCVYIGDHRRDIEAGHAAGMTTIAAEWGYISPEEDPTQWQAHYHLSSATALEQWLKASLKSETLKD